MLAYADLAPFVEALFDQLAALLERPVFACCDSPQPDPAWTCQACGAELTDDQLRALVDCTHPTVADIPAGERSPCPDCGLVWCQALAAINVQHHELTDGRTAHQAGGDVLIVTPTEGW
jgi:DNA-directed RNA polymerase subunit RPC12/RpoP